jgi:hypothetical protein
VTVDSAPPLTVDPAAMRAAALGGILQIVRARRGWKILTAATETGIAPMTWRRLESGLPVRERSLAALDPLLDCSPGMVKRTLGDDALMLQLIAWAGVDTSDVPPEAAAEFVATFAAQSLSGTSPLAHHPRPGSDIEAAANVLNRLTLRPSTPRIAAAVRALLDVMPDLLPDPPA